MSSEICITANVSEALILKNSANNSSKMELEFRYSKSFQVTGTIFLIHSSTILSDCQFFSSKIKFENVHVAPQQDKQSVFVPCVKRGQTDLFSYEIWT